MMITYTTPSAVLASRVISAHDNPSPPPSPPIPDPLLDAPLIDFSSPAGHPVQAIDNQPPSTPPYDHPESNTRILQDLFAPVSPSPRSSARADFLPPPFSFEVAPSLALLAPEDVDIAFTPTDASPVQKIRNHPSEYLPSHHEEPEQSNEGSDVAHDSAEEQAVAASLQADISSVTPSPIEVEPPSPPLPIVEPPDQSEVQTPPLRRSTRPRKSIAPNLLDVNSPGSRQSSPLSGSAKKES
ncbi:hypothetical protein BDN72DRAFT_237915 [Pluteus cervinus]|uniref:Uncharacterized protein n=1 Tax=Pluteus cervinus TaxID=181527 RepID=A0ACD3BE48_9AGAR|nr:hypothetical protein BDN72DRAFT_237915 [Pluteus cervinus]